MNVGERALTTASRPNFVIVMADDLDVLLNGTAAMTTLRKELVDGGLSLRGHVDVPICCPSRTSTLSGRYPHNLNDTLVGWCGNFGAVYEGHTWVGALKSAGYETALFGKYYNDYSAFCESKAHVPADFSYVDLLCDDNHYFGNKFNENGTMMTLSETTYMTQHIGNASMGWLRNAAAKAAAGGAPFLTYIGVHAPHVPATPAHEYENAPLPGGVYTAPRPPSWNVTASPDAFWLEAGMPPLSQSLESYSDELYARRMRAMFSVDDIVAALYRELRAAGVEDNTLVLFTSDHGYNLGEHRFPSGKFHHWEHDVRVPFHLTGLGVPRGVALEDAMVSNVDIGPTLLALAGVPYNTFPLDGRSFVPLLQPQGADAAASAWPRDRLLFEYWGSGYTARGPCANGTTACPGGVEALEDAPSNSWSALRIHNASADVLYVEWRPTSKTPVLPGNTNHTEGYDLASDPWQLVNLAPSGLVSGMSVAALSRELWAVATCAGSACP
jgi:N-acetylglucosamine-6-sulfatase